MVQVTTNGLTDTPAIPSSIPVAQWAIATGTADAIEAEYDPEVLGLTDGLFLCFRAAAANTSTTPTFSPNGLSPFTITKSGGAALVAGDIVGAGFEVMVRLNLASARWELLNPHTP